jgi:hypothetical protein
MMCFSGMRVGFGVAREACEKEGCVGSWLYCIGEHEFAATVL